MLETLIDTAATTIVAAMATSAWQAARDGMAGLFRCFGSREQADSVERTLDGNASQVEKAKDPTITRDRLRGSWVQLLEELLEARPDAAQELQSLVTQVQAALPPAQQHWVQTIVASGPGSVAAGAMGGNVIFHGPATGSSPAQQ